MSRVGVLSRVHFAVRNWATYICLACVASVSVANFDVLAARKLESKKKERGGRGRREKETKHLVSPWRGILTKTFPELILITNFTWRLPLGRLSMFKNWSRLSLFSFSDIWRLSCPNFKVFRGDFPLFLFVTGGNTRTDLHIGLLPSGVSSRRLFAGVDLLISPSVDFLTNE